MNVLKFGGAVLNSIEGLSALVSTVAAQEEHSVVVISAFGKTTRDLLDSAEKAREGLVDEAEAALAEIVSWHAGFILSLKRESDNDNRASDALRASSVRLKEILRGISLTGQLTKRTRDLVASYGESMALFVVAEALSKKAVSTTILQSTDIFVTDDNHGDAKPDLQVTTENIVEQIQPALERGHVLIQGFVARSQTGQITTMGIESSSLTAAIIAAALRAVSMVVFSDVEGVRTADPAFARTHSLVPQLSYAQAHSAALNGVKVLHPRMLEPLKNAEIPLFVKSAFAPQGDATRISSQDGQHYCIAAMHEQLYILHCGYIFRTDLPEYEEVLTTLFPDRIGLLSDTYRKDSACIVSTRSPKANVLEHLTGFDFVLESKPVVTLIGIKDTLPVLRSLYEQSQVPTSFLEVGQQPGIIRIGADMTPSQLYHTVLQILQ